MDTKTVVWEEPAGPEERPGREAEFAWLAKALIKNPNKWAFVKKFDADEANNGKELARAIRRGTRGFQLLDGQPGLFDSEYRRQSDGSLKVWAKYCLE